MVASDGHADPAPSVRRQPVDTLPSLSTRLQHELTIEEARDQDSSIVTMHPSTVAQLALMVGDTVRLKGTRDREAYAILREAADVPEEMIQVSAVMRTNLRCGLSETTKVY